MSGIPGLGLSSPLGLGVDGDRVPWLSAPLGSNPNLLVFPEDFSNAAWTNTLVTVTTDVGDATHPNADRLAIPANRGSRQTTSIAATTASFGGNVTLTSSWARYSFSGTADGLPYTFSCELLGEVIATFSMKVDVSGGFLRVRLDAGPVSPVQVLAWGAKLEQAASFSQYP